jgi:hypothetical protein
MIEHDPRADAHGVATQLSPDEGDALALLDAMLGLRTGAGGGQPAAGPLRPAFVRLAVEHCRVAVARWFTAEHGFRERAVLRGGARARGRIWDEALCQEWTPRFSAQPLRFWLALTRAASRGARAPTGPSGAAKTVGWRDDLAASREVLLGPSVAAAGPAWRGPHDGDWVLFARAALAIPALGLHPEDARAALAEARSQSPLAALFALELASEDLEEGGRLGQLLERPVVRALECVQDRMAAAWEAELAALWARTRRLGLEGRAAEGAETSEGASALRDRWRSAGRTLDAYVRAADLAGRTDLLRPVFRLLDRLSTRVVPPDAARELVAHGRGWRTISERDALIDAVRSIPEVSLAAARVREALADERYGEERYEEAQLFLRDWAEELVPCRAAVAELIRALSRSVG